MDPTNEALKKLGRWSRWQLAFYFIVCTAVGWHADYSRSGPLANFQVVTLEDGKVLHVARHEVTVGEWRECVRDAACQSIPSHQTQSADHPATMINWLDAQAYTKWLSRKSGQLEMPSILLIWYPGPNF